ncbi:MAG: sigma 54-interacting transcriptional regulator [Candidatus Eisenbacteria bacterium]|nr:sigma 54-interacting transcriptional regulator [Candidatus Eisenbacteria bacterium]
MDGAKRIVTGDHGTRAVLREAERIAPAPVPVLLEGESGTGKELLARLLHERSGRADRPFLAVNCAALCENLAESELFGHVAGAFTGALRERRGLFEETDGGSLFLDEIGDLAPPLQAKLLRVLQEGTIRRVGECVPRPVRFRLIAATHRDLRMERDRGRFREDLFYRVHVVTLRLPPLRERSGDVARLARYFLAVHAARLGRPIAGIDDEALRLLERYRWPGNVRELENEMQRVVALTEEGGWIGPGRLSDTVRIGAGEEEYEPKTLQEKIDRMEKREILRALRRLSGNKTRAARELGLSRQGLKNKLLRHGITVDGPHANGLWAAEPLPDEVAGAGGS